MGKGLQRICRSLGAIKINGKRFVWDYEQEKAVPDSDIPEGSEKWQRNEKLRFEKFMQQLGKT